MVPLSISQINFIVVYFIYGLAFFTMGLALSLESGRSPSLAQRTVLTFLAVFGVLHGLHEWIEIYLIQMVWLGGPLSAQISWFRVSWLALSFVPLVIFSVLELRSRLFNFIGAGSVGLYLFLFFSAFASGTLEMAQSADVLARYLLAVPGASMAGYAFIKRARLLKAENQIRLASNFQLASTGFFFYGLTQLFVPVVDFFPANLVNSQVFLDLAGFPVQVVRAAMALLVTLGLLRAVQLMEAGRQAQLFSAQQAQLEALEQVKQELVARELMRKELLRHIVIAQEDERARIARELHDETAQILTAISLNLATLQRSVRGEASQIIERLQSLSRQMSRGIHNLVHDLRPAQLDDLGLVPALQYLCEVEHKRTGLVVTCEVEGNRQRLDQLVETVIFRVAQEALTNTSRHSGADQARMQVLFLPDKVVLRVSDQGKGFDLKEEPIAPHGWGLAGMRERVESVGGELNIRTAQGKGTVVEVNIPHLEADSADLKEVFNGDKYPHRIGG
jgi:two-component system, NarL family, sensor histidine kinase UhpB